MLALVEFGHEPEGGVFGRTDPAQGLPVDFFIGLHDDPHALVNIGPARAAWLAGIVAEVDPTGDLSPAERERRAASAMRVRMTRLAMARWAKRRKRVDPAPWR